MLKAVIEVIIWIAYNKKEGGCLNDAVKLNGEEENLELLEGFTLLDDEFMTLYRYRYNAI